MSYQEGLMSYQDTNGLVQVRGVCRPGLRPPQSQEPACSSSGTNTEKP